jgi:hypothetical protein
LISLALVLQRQTQAALLLLPSLAAAVASPAQTFKSSPLQAHPHGLSQRVQSWFMCCFLAVVLAAALVAVEQPLQSLLVHLVVAVEAAVVEQNCGFLL